MDQKTAQAIADQLCEKQDRWIDSFPATSADWRRVAKDQYRKGVLDTLGALTKRGAIADWALSK